MVEKPHVADVNSEEVGILRVFQITGLTLLSVSLSVCTFFQLLSLIAQTRISARG